jgi:Ca2+-binding RTX toxin-like protein
MAIRRLYGDNFTMKPGKFPIARLLACTLAAAVSFLSAGTARAVTDPTLSVAAARSGTNLILTWFGPGSIPYQVQWTTNLANWKNIGPVITSSGAQMSFTNSGLTQRRMLFRVQRVFPATPGTASFDPSTGLLTIVGDLEHTNLSIVNDGLGNIVVVANGGALLPITGGVPTTANTILIQVLGSIGDDQISVGNGLPPAHLFGGEGNDILSGGSASDTLVGGPGSDTLIGRQGNDILYPDGDDTVVWNPGDGSDLIQGSGRNNTLLFNGANINENFELSANGPRLRFTRNVANIVLDADGIQTVTVNALGGTDNVIVDDLTGTAVTRVNVDLAAIPGTTNADGAIDSVIVTGTSGPDTFNVAANGNAVEVTGVGARIDVTGTEVGNDRIAFVGVGGDTVNVNGTGGADTMQILPSLVAGYVETVVSGYSVSVDVTGDLTLAVNGLGGPDTIIGLNGVAPLGIPIVLNGGDGDDVIVGTDADDTIYGGNGNDMVTGGRGNDLVFLGDGNDTFIWNPGDGSDVVEGETGTDTLQFNGANINENFDLSANGSRLRFTRNVATIVTDANGIETINLRALGGADNVTVNDLTGTGVTQVNVDLGSSGGGGDGAVDTVTVDGTAAPDNINVTAPASTIQVTGLSAAVQITNPEVANDSLVVNGLGGIDSFSIGPGVTTLIGVIFNQ